MERKNNQTFSLSLNEFLAIVIKDSLEKEDKDPNQILKDNCSLFMLSLSKEEHDIFIDFIKALKENNCLAGKIFGFEKTKKNKK